MYTFSFSESEMDFFRQLFNSELPITIKTAELVGALRAKMMNAQADHLFQKSNGSDLKPITAPRSSSET